MESIKEFNAVNPIGSIFELSFLKNKFNELGTPTTKSEKLVSVVTY